MVEPVLGASMLGRARTRGLVDIRAVNLRDYAEGRHRITDDYQFGGGGGMVLQPQPLFAAVDALRTPGARALLMDPRGRTFTQAVPAGPARHARLGRAPLRRSRADRAVAARAGAVGHVADTAGTLEGRAHDIRRAAGRRTIRARGDAGADRLTRRGLRPPSEAAARVQSQQEREPSHGRHSVGRGGAGQERTWRVWCGRHGPRLRPRRAEGEKTHTALSAGCEP